MVRSRLPNPGRATGHCAHVAARPPLRDPHCSLDLGDAPGRSGSPSDGQGVVAGTIPSRHVSARLDQDSTDARPVPGRREHQWGEATIVAGVQIIATLDVKLDGGLNAADDRHFQQPIERSKDCVRRCAHEALSPRR